MTTEELIMTSRVNVTADMKSDIPTTSGVIGILNSTTATMTTVEDRAVEINVVYVTIEVLIAVMIVIGNSLVILVYVRTRRLRTVTNSYVMSLASADLLVALIGIPSAILTSVGLPADFDGCIFMNSVLLVLTTASIFSLVAVTVDRFYAIAYPFGYHVQMTRRRAALINVSCWILASVIGFLPSMGWNLGRPPRPQCFFMEVIDLKYLLFIYILTMILPAVFMAVVYAKIFCEVRRQVRSTSISYPPLTPSSTANTLSLTSGSTDRGVGEGGGEGERKGDGARSPGVTPSLLLDRSPINGGGVSGARAAEGRAALRISIVVIMFIISWFPLYTFNFSMFICQSFHLECPVPEGLVLCAVVLSHLNSAWNPALYAWAMTDFKRALRKLFGCRVKADGSSFIDVVIRRTSAN